MAAEISMPMYIRVGDDEARYGDLTVPMANGVVHEADVRRQLVASLRAAADYLESTLTEEVQDAAAHG